MSLQGSVKPGYIITGRVTELDYILMTAYGIALQNGFVGTEQEWLDSLDGTKVPEETLVKLIAQYFIEHPVEDGLPGHDGTTFYPSVDSAGNLSWTNDGNKTNPATVNIKGEKGDKGDTGEKGADGAAGKDGADGTNGKDGEDGADGVTPVKGVDYYTEEEQVQLVNDVIEALGIVYTKAIDFTNWTSGSFTETLNDGSTVTHAVVFDADGVVTKVGDVTVSGVL